MQVAPAVRQAVTEAIAGLTRLVSGRGPRLDTPRWVVVARVEGQEAENRPGGPLTSEVIDEILATFDPAARPVPILFAGRRGTNPHFAEGLPPAGEVLALDRDARNLWAHVASVIDPVLDLPRIDVGVADGFTGVSVGFLPESEEVGGLAQLLHVAQASDGQRLGMANLPRLHEFGFGLDDEQIAQLRESPEGLVAGMRSEDAAQELERFGWRTWATTSAGAAGEKENDVTNEELEAALKTHGESMTEAIRTAVAEAVVEGLKATDETDEGDKPQGRTEPDNAGSQARGERTADTDDDDEGGKGAAKRAEELQRRAAVAVRRAVLAKACHPQQAAARVLELVSGGEPAVRAYEVAVSDVSRARGGITKEVQVDDQTSLRVKSNPLAYHTFGMGGMRADEEQLEALVIATHQLKAERQGQGRRLSPTEIAHRAIELRS